MNRRLRFAAWCAAVAGAMAASLVDFRLLSCGCLAALVMLLWTTPPTAIRLPGAVSVMLVTGLVAVVQAASLERGRTTAAAALLSVGLSFLLTLWLNRRGTSSWWAAPLVWGPWMAAGWSGVGCAVLAGPPIVLLASRYFAAANPRGTTRL